MKTTTKQTPHDITTTIHTSETDNKRLSLFVHRDSNTSIGLHDVISVVMGKNRTLIRDDGVPFVVRDITITHENGKTTEISLFIK